MRIYANDANMRIILSEEIGFWDNPQRIGLVPLLFALAQKEGVIRE